MASVSSAVVYKKNMREQTEEGDEIVKFSWKSRI